VAEQQCATCEEYFGRFQCGAHIPPFECDCPKCQGYCTCPMDYTLDPAPLEDRMYEAALAAPEVAVRCPACDSQAGEPCYTWRSLSLAYMRIVPHRARITLYRQTQTDRGLDTRAILT
jgi:hypothetical protein